MSTLNITTTVIGIILFLIILVLVRRGHLQEKYSLIWFTIGLAVMVLGIFPRIIDKIGRMSGIRYPPILLLVIAVGVLLVLSLRLFIITSQNEVHIRKLLQQTAVLEKLVGELSDRDRPVSTESEELLSE
jgi:hypothetical protein